MNDTNLIVDGMLSGTGVRDGSEGGYLTLSDLGLTTELVLHIQEWLQRYEQAHYHQFGERSEVELLDSEGVSIARALKDELPTAHVSYFSNADMKYIHFK